MSKKKKKKSNKLSGRFAIFFTVLLFVCTIIFFNNRLASGSLKRMAYWIFNGVRADATETTVNFDANEYNRFFLIGGNLCVLSPEKFSSYTFSGSNNFSKQVLLRTPAVSTSSSKFIAYDLGGLSFNVFNKNKLLYSGVCDSKIISANMTESGNFTIVTDGTNAKNTVTLYNKSFKPIFKFHSSERHVFDAAPSPSCKTVGIITYGASEGRFESYFSLCNINSDSFYSTTSLGNSTPLKLVFFSDNNILIICNDKTVVFDINGNIVSEISYGTLPLKGFSVASKKNISILLDDYQNGGNTKVLFIKSNGTLTGELSFDEDIFSISSSEKYTALQFSNRCVVYKADMSVYCEFEIPTSISQCLVNKDGSVLSIGNNFATLFVK